MRLLSSCFLLLGALTTLVASPPAVVQAFHSSDGKQLLKLNLPPAREEYEGDEPDRRYCIADKGGHLRVWYQLFQGCDANKILDLAFHGQLPPEFRVKEGEQFSKRLVHLNGHNLIRLIDPTGRYVIHVVESEKDTWIIATWSLGWRQEKLRHQYVRAFISAIPGYRVH